MAKGEVDIFFVLAFFVLMIMSIAANVQESGQDPEDVGAVGGLSVAFSGAFDQIFGSGDRACMFLKDDTGYVDPMFPDMANWQCVLIFGLLPFTILYFFMHDILAFTMISERTKSMLALGVAIFAMQLKLLVSVTNFLADLTNNLLGGPLSLFGLLIMMGIMGSLLGQFGLTMRMAADASMGTGEAIYGLRTMRAIGRQVENQAGRQR